MKRLFLSLVISLLAVTTFAQLKSIDAKLDYQVGIIGPKGDPGIGAGITYELAENFDLVPRFMFYVVDSGKKYTIEADLHYNLTELNDNMYFYPLIGVGLYHNNWKDDPLPNEKEGKKHNHNKALLNAGAGLGYPMNDSFTLIGELKYQAIAGEKGGTHLSIGLSYVF